MILSKSLAACLKVLICLVLIFLILGYYGHIKIQWKFKWKFHTTSGQSLVGNIVQLNRSSSIDDEHFRGFANSTRRMVNFKGTGIYGVETFCGNLEKKNS